MYELIEDVNTRMPDQVVPRVDGALTAFRDAAAVQQDAPWSVL